MPPIVTKAFGVPVGVLAVFELLCRLVFVDGFTGRFEYGYSPTAGFVRNGATVELHRAGGRRFYPQSFAQDKPAGRIRVFSIGDSIARGDGLELSYPSQLEHVLREQGLDVESFNLAVTGYGATRKHLVLQQALAYQPDLIVLHVNDFNEGQDARDWDRKRAFESWHPRQWLLKSWALRRAYEWKFERAFMKYLPGDVRLLRSVRDPTVEWIAAEQDPVKLQAWQHRSREKTRESVTLARVQNVPLILLTTAQYRPHSPPRLDAWGLDEFARGLTGPGVHHVATGELFVGQDYAAMFSGDGLHWATAGHRRAAEQLAPRVQQALREQRAPRALSGSPP
ncbi:MAG: GDSL-type esterase/lipase family protein [Nevskiales bacterium]|nr:GDSL-type esterase/lipase family protein [Nevskiales bacterium]